MTRPRCAACGLTVDARLGRDTHRERDATIDPPESFIRIVALWALSETVRDLPAMRDAAAHREVWG